MHVFQVDNAKYLAVAAPIREQLADAIRVVPEDRFTVGRPLGLGLFCVILRGWLGRGGGIRFSHVSSGNSFG